MTLSGSNEPLKVSSLSYFDIVRRSRTQLFVIVAALRAQELLWRREAPPQ